MTSKRRLTKAVLSVGVAGSLLFGTMGATAPVAASLFNLKIKENNRTDIVQSLLTAAESPGPTQVARPASVKIDNTGDGVEDIAYRWEWRRRV
jgi:hypothetical protein